MIVDRIRSRLSAGRCHGAIEAPAEGSTVSGTIEVVGWAFWAGTAIAAIEVHVDGVFLGRVPHGRERTDVAARYSSPEAARSGYSGTFPIPDGIAAGEHTLVVRVVRANQKVQLYRRRIRILEAPAKAPSPNSGEEGVVIGNLEAPLEGSAFSETIAVVGWAFSKAGLIHRVEALVDGALLGTLQYGVDRPDVASAYAHPTAARSGYTGVFSVPDRVGYGEHFLDVRVIDGNQSMLDQRRRIRLVPSPIETWLDVPAEGSSLVGVVEVAGWAFSREAPIVTVEASLDGAAVRGLRYGDARVDVAAAFPDQAPVECGYLGQLTINPGASGAATLRVRIVDANGNQRETTRSVVIRPARVRLMVDLPAAEATSEGTLVIRGWAVSRGAPIVAVQAWLGDRAPSALSHGSHRPDVGGMYANPEGDRCGFEGLLVFDAVDAERTEQLVVRATDAFEEIAEVRIPVRIVVPQEPAESVESDTSPESTSPIEALVDVPAEGSSLAGIVEVAGWAFSREAPIVTVEGSIDGTAAGALRYGGERADVVVASPEAPVHCAYTGELLIDPASAKAATLRVRIVDAKGNRREMTRLVAVRPTRVRLTVDLPAVDATSEGTLVIRGWAVSRGARIVAVQAWLGDRAASALVYGSHRPDVGAVYDNPDGEHCGFEGLLVLDAVDAEHTESLVVRASDASGEIAEVRVPVRVVVPEKPPEVVEAETSPASISCIEAWLDEPAERSSLAGIVTVSGWAFSRVAPIVAAEASVGDAELHALRYGHGRPDVATRFLNQAPRECGFHGQVSVDPRASGPAMLHVRVVDAHGNQHGITREVVVTLPRVRLWVDVPQAESVSGGTLVIRGWAFSRGGRIVHLQAWLGNRAHTVLAHGFCRPDVVAAFTDSEAERSGFEGVLNFEASNTERTERLVVHATDERGEIAGIEIPIRIAWPGEPLCEVERVRWSGNRLEVDGWVAWPESTAPRRIWVFVGAALAGEATPNRSRPDLRNRFPAYPAGSFRGFHLSAFFDPVETQVGTRSPLVIECVDGEGRRIQRTTSIVHEPRVDAASASCDTLPKIEEAVASVRARLQREPTILDWRTGLELGAALPHSVVFSPPSAADTPTLPYLDHSVDIVVVQAGEAARLAEAHRVAAVATVEIYAGSGASLPKLCWQLGAPAAPPPVMTSIIIPVHDQVRYTDACLKQLMATLPAGFRGEIIVVDDASTDETPTVLSRWAESSPLVRVLRNDENAGFLQSCNRAAAAATGEVLVFLNNDTLPQPGWLLPLLRLLRDDPSAGAVGGKLLYPDGTLQEAGGVIFSDASGYNFGRHDRQPNGPLFSYVREVDYCSGALLAIRRALFLEMGGFDLRYSPAYYEDPDLCFRLRQKGYRVYYQPDSVVVHFEGATSGTDTGAGVKRYQVVNREKFKARWHEVLAEQPSPPPTFDARARHTLSVRDGQPRVLVCAPRMPEYDREGGSQRVFHFIDFLREAGWAVSFVAQNGTGGERYVRLLQQRGVATYAGPESQLAGDEYLEDFDELIAMGGFNLALLVFWDVAEQLLPRFRSLSPNTRVIVDSIDLHFLRSARSVLHRSSGHTRGALGRDYADRMIREMNAYTAADVVLTVSQKEADLINDMANERELAESVPLMEDLPRSPLDLHERSGLLFIGNFRHPPNLEGLDYLCTDILPRVDPTLLAHNPLYVVGNELDDSVRKVVGDLEHVRLVGWVPSLVPYLQRARVSVIPLLHGAGTKTKLIQALMTGTPSVSTRIGIEGLGLTDGEHVLVADTPEDFAAQLERLVGDAALWRQLATQGRAHIERTHGRDVVRARLLAAVERVMSRPSAATQPR